MSLFRIALDVVLTVIVIVFGYYVWTLVRG